MKREQSIDEKRRFRSAIAAHATAALIKAWGEDHPNTKRLAWIAVDIADAVMARLEETDPYKE